MMGNLYGIISVAVFIVGLVVIIAMGDAIEIRTNTWIPSFVLVIVYFIAFIYLLLRFAAQHKNKEK